MQYDPILSLEKIVFDTSKRNDLYEAYHQDLKDFIDSIGNSEVSAEIRRLEKRYLLSKLEQKWYPLLSFDSSTIKNDIAELQTPKKEFKQSFNLKEMLDKYNPASNWLIPQLLRSAGLFILAGEPKVGKSIIGYHLAYAVAISGRFLGKPVRKGRVLYIQIEEDSSTISERLHFVGFGNKKNKAVNMAVEFDPEVVVFDRTFDATIDIPRLYQRIAELSPSLVIIDSLRAATINSQVSETDSQFGKLVAAIQQVFNQTDTCGVLIHHMNKEANKGKNKHTGSLVNAISGSTAIASNSSGIIALYAADKDEYSKGAGKVIIRTLPRNGLPFTVTYSQATTDTGLWELCVESEEDISENVTTSKILRFLATHAGQFFSASDISRNIQTEAFFEVKQSLGYLSTNQTIVWRCPDEVVEYALPVESLWIVDPEKNNGGVKPEIVDANILSSCKTKTELYEKTEAWSKSQRQSALRLLSKEEKDRLDALRLSFLYQVGDVVSHNGEDFTVTARSEKASLRDVTYTVVDESGTEYVLEEMLIDGIAGNVVVVESSVVIEESIEDEF
jgi:hypothetical protein